MSYVQNGKHFFNKILSIRLKDQIGGHLGFWPQVHVFWLQRPSDIDSKSNRPKKIKMVVTIFFLPIFWKLGTDSMGPSDTEFESNRSNNKEDERVLFVIGPLRSKLLVGISTYLWRPSSLSDEAHLNL